MQYINEAGTFECVVEKPTAGWFGESEEKKTPFIRIPVVVKDGPNMGQTAVYNAWLSAGAFDNTIARLAEVFGFDGDLASLQLGKQTFAGMPCSVQVEGETYNGKTYFKVKWLNPSGGGGGKPMDEQKVSDLIKRLGPKAKAIAKATPKQTTAPTPVESVPDPSDDVPF